MPEKVRVTFQHALFVLPPMAACSVFRTLRALGSCCADRSNKRAIAACNDEDARLLSKFNASRMGFVVEESKGGRM